MGMHTRAVGLLLLLPACIEPPSSPSVDSGSPEPGPPVERLDLGEAAAKNLIILNVDTLRADALPPWGSVHDTTPHMDTQGWHTVSQVVATASWTAPSTASLLTGVDLPSHGIRSLTMEGAQGSLSSPSFAAALTAAGFRTAAFSGSELFLLEGLDLAEGFEVRAEVSDEPGNSEATVAAAMDWLESGDLDQPFFLFLQPTDPHAPYRPTDADLGTWADLDAVPFELDAPAEVQEHEINEKFAALDEGERAEMLTALRSVYDEQVLGVDRAVDALLGTLARLGHAEDTLVVLTGDHGESFFDGDPEMLGHGIETRQELVHVPLMFWGAGVPAGATECVASNMDILPTALDVLGLPPLPSAEGRSLLGGCRSRAFSSVYEADAGGEWLSWVSIEREGAQVVRNCVTGEAMAFDLAADPGATQTLAVSEVHGAALLAAELDTYVTGVAARLPVTCAWAPDEPGRTPMYGL